MAKQKVFLDWYGNPLSEDHRVGICRSSSRLFFAGEVDPDGKKYIRAYTSGGVPGDRLALEDCYLCITDESGKVLYDSRCEPPPDAVLKPGYIGYEREKQLKRYFPGCVFAASSARFMNWASARIFPRRATHRERWRLPNRVQWP